MIRIAIISFIVLSLACNNNNIANSNIQPNDSVRKDVKSVASSVGNDTIYRQPLDDDTASLALLHDSLFRLPEVQKINKQILTATANKHGVSMIDYPIKDSVGKYEISVGYNGDFKFERKLSFFVDVRTMNIMVEDNSSGEYLSLESFHKRNEALDTDTASVRR